MSTKIRARLASRADVEQALAPTALAPLSLPLSQDALKRLAQSLLAAAFLYLEERSRRTPEEVREELASLKRRVDRVLDDPPNEAARHDAIAAVTALRRGARSGGAFQHLAGLCVRTAQPVAGRNRPTGRQSTPRLQWTSAQPPAPRARPTHNAEQRLCLMVAAAYVEATGKWPTCWGPHTDDNKASPFTRLMKAVLRACGARGVDARELVRWYLRHHANPAAGAKKATSTA